MSNIESVTLVFSGCTSQNVTDTAALIAATNGHLVGNVEGFSGNISDYTTDANKITVQNAGNSFVSTDTAKVAQILDIFDGA